MVAKTYFPSLKGRTSGYIDESHANANLIAAAPDMYEALHMLLDANGAGLKIAATMKAKTALAKADGEAS